MVCSVHGRAARRRNVDGGAARNGDGGRGSLPEIAQGGHEMDEEVVPVRNRGEMKRGAWI